MKVGIIVQPNSKGQIVIPQKIRKDLEINEKTPLNILVRDKGFYVYPIERIETGEKFNKEAYLRLLEQTRGAWGPATKEEIEKEKKSRKLELEASKARKNAW